ncbi:hypothetical protein AC578_1723 [Pseudocercospora eumusae]|uniref:Fork-head domain-containing protein n=1 Tax=Pseudocercospora eumusae TaxID=321146 RepID=A0A139H016_9PEZI|nr:hypothetical protein AC578_1723 [Pseudocercospora eumusae]
MAMEVHATTLPLRDNDSMTAASGDVGVTESHAQPRQSLSCDPEWREFLQSLGQDNQTITNMSSNMDLGYFSYDDTAPANFGAMEDVPHADPLSATTTNSSSSSSISEPNAAPQPFQPAWPIVPEHQTMFNCGPMTYQHPPWVPEQQFEPPVNHFGFQNGDGLGIHMPPTSNPVDLPNQIPYQNGFMDHHSPREAHDNFGDPNFDHGWPRHHDMPADDLFFDEGEDGGESADPCYAQLLYKCLKEAPNYTLSLRELYEWVAHHSQKAKDPKNRGWQNSVRHNLSMNAAFIRVQPGPGSGQKKGSLWRLTDEALREGVISTTRYRKDPKRRPERRAVPALNRQVSGAKGGRATRDASRLRQQQQQQQQAQQQRYHGLPLLHHRSRRSDRHRHGPAYSPYGVRSAPHSPVGQPHFIPPMSTPQPPSHPPSPYFNIVEDNQIPFGDELTPTGFALPGQQPAPLPENSIYPFDDSNTKPSSVTSFEMLPLDLTQAPLFGDHDPELAFDPNTPTPSLMTEESFMADESVPQLMSCGTSREGTTF